MKKFLLAVAAFFAPVLALAQTNNPTGSIQGTFTNLNTTANSATGLVSNLTRTVNAAVPLLLAVAVVVFIYSVIRFIGAKGGIEKAKFREYLIYSVIAIAVILAIFGLAKFLTNFFGISTGTGGITPTDVPAIPAAPNPAGQ